MVLHLPTGPLKTRSGLELVRGYTNPVPTSPIADDIATAPSGPVIILKNVSSFISVKTLLYPVLFFFLPRSQVLI